jgi:hypothetical protein
MARFPELLSVDFHASRAGRPVRSMLVHKSHAEEAPRAVRTGTSLVANYRHAWDGEKRSRGALAIVGAIGGSFELAIAVAQDNSLKQAAGAAIAVASAVLPYYLSRAVSEFLVTNQQPALDVKNFKEEAFTRGRQENPLGIL